MMSGYFGGAAWLWSMHWLFGTMFMVGLVLLIIWMAKNLDKKRLQMWITILLVAGALGCFLTSVAGGGARGWKKMMDFDDWDEVEDVK